MGSIRAHRRPARRRFLIDLGATAVFALAALACTPDSGKGPAATSSDVGGESGRLIELVADDSAPGLQRMDAATELGKSGDRRAVPPLITVLESDMERRTGVWAAVIPALGELGDPRAVPILVRAMELRDEDWLGREMAASALGEIGDPEAVPALLSAASMADTRGPAVEALAAIGDARAAPLYVDALAGGDWPETIQVAERALLALGAEAVPHLTAALDAPPEADPKQAAAAARLLGELGDPSALPALKKAADDPRQEVRKAASSALLKIEGKGKNPW
jgi:HEAT repeat protein